MSEEIKVEEKIVVPKVLLQIVSDDVGRLNINTIIKEKEILINLLLDTIKIINNQKESPIIKP